MRDNRAAGEKRRSLVRFVLLLAIVLLAVWTGVRAQSSLVPTGPPLIVAVRAVDVAAVRALLAEAVDVNARQPDGATALHWAMHREHVEIADLLIGAGADVDTANDLGVTPLLMASARGHGELVERLLAAGASPVHANKWGFSARDWASWPQNGSEITARLREKIS